MSELKHSTPTQNKTSSVAFWGTIILSAILLLVFAGVLLLTILALSAVPGSSSDATGTFIAYEVAVVMAVIVITILAGLIFTIRGNQAVGYRLAYLSIAMFVLNTSTLVGGQALSMSFLLLILSTFGVGWLSPSRSRRSYVVATLIILALVWVVELINPSWRADYSGAQLGPIGAVVFVFIFAILVTIQTWGRSMRNKLMAAFVGIALLASGILAVYIYLSTNNILQQSLEKELTQHTHGIASGIADLLKEQVNSTKTLALNEVLEEAAEDANNAYDGNTAIQSVLEVKDDQWRAADAADNNNHPLVHEYLTNSGAHELIEFQKAFPNHIEMFITDVYGGLAGTTNRTSDFYQADEDWWQAAYNNGEGAVYISEPEYDESADALAVLIAVPMRNDETGEIVGILRTTYLASGFNSILDEQVGETSMQDILIPAESPMHYHQGGLELLDGEEFAQLQSISNQGMVEMYYEGADSVVVTLPVKTTEGNSAVDSLGWMVLFHQHQDEAFAPVNEQMRGVLIVMVIVMVLAVGAAIGLSWFLVRPISQLTQTAEEFAAGNLNSRATVTSADEVGILASTFNSMTSQLQETLQGLEQRVAARTRDLAIVAEVGTATATILESKRLLQEVVDLTKERFHLYHSHIYLLDEKGENLVLTAGAGEPGRVMVAEGRSIPLSREQSLVARAARERKGVTVNDVTQAPDFLPNPLLPDTRSELAVPMVVGGNVIGVFDIQSEQVGRFTDSDVNIQTTLAAQLATSIQNVRSFEQSKKQAELQSLVNVIGSRIQRTTSIEETLQTAIRELGTAIGASRVKASISRRGDGNDKVGNN